MKRPMKRPVQHIRRSAIRVIVEDYGWIHLGLGMAGNALFVIGSVMFLPRLGEADWPFLAAPLSWQTIGIWFFIMGSTLMFIGSLGELLVSLYNRRRRQPSAKARSRAS